MQSEWQLQEAKNNFSQLIKRAASGRAQLITVHGKPTAVVFSSEEYARLTRQRNKLSDTLLRPDLAAEDVDVTRSRLSGAALNYEVGVEHLCVVTFCSGALGSLLVF